MAPMKKGAPTTLAAFRLEPELLAGLKAIRERDGILISWQVRQAIREWLDSKGVVVKAAPEHVSARPETLSVNLL
jgi:Ribbon-helix-helix protein, copG family